MKILGNKSPVWLSDVEVGSTFYRLDNYGAIYMRINATNDDNILNIVNLSDGSVLTYSKQNQMRVVPVRIEATIM